jgi:hypothetical protein
MYITQHTNVLTYANDPDRSPGGVPVYDFPIKQHFIEMEHR